MSRARDKANSTVSNFASTGIDDNADATAITIDSSERVGIATPATSNARCLLHTHPSGTGSIPTNYLVQQDDNNLGLVIMNTNDSSTYSGLRIETRSNQAAGWLVANEFQSAFNGDLVFRARNAGSTSAEIARMKSSGGITFNGDTAAANALDDYEEGTWSPAIYYQNSDDQTNSNNDTQIGFYVKVGTLVTAVCYLKWDATNSRANDNIGVSNLPFIGSQVSGNNEVRYTAPLSYSATSYPQGDSQVLAVTNPGNNLVSFLTANGGGNLGDEFGQNNNMEVRFTLHYVTN